MASSSQIEAHICGFCRKPASIACNDCKDAPWSEHSKAWYCNNECRESDRQQHKSSCFLAQYRLLVYRTAICLHAMFLDFRCVTYSTWEPVVTYVEENRNGEILVHYCDNNSSGSPVDIVCGFPETIRQALSQRQFEGIMMSSACRDFPTWMLELMIYALCSTQVDIYEVTIATKLHPKVIFVDTDRTEIREKPRHEVYRMVFPNGEAYAFDPTCAQYGDYMPILPWDEYSATRIECICQQTPIEVARIRKDQMIDDIKRTKRPILLFPRIHLDLCSQKLIGWVKEWEHNNVFLAAALRIDMVTAEGNIGELRRFVKEKLQNYVSTGLVQDVRDGWGEAEASLFGSRHINS